MSRVTRLYPDESDRWEVRECKAPEGATWQWPLGRSTQDGEMVPEGIPTESEGTYVRLSLIATRPEEIFLTVFYEGDPPGTMRPTAPMNHDKAVELWQDLGEAIQQNGLYGLRFWQPEWDEYGQVSAMQFQMEAAGWETIAERVKGEDACVTMAIDAPLGYEVARICPTKRGPCRVQSFFVPDAAATWMGGRAHERGEAS